MNIGEIARRAGVSRSTVSYALSGKRAVSEDTRRKIQRVIDELDYRPNASARALANGRTNTIGLVFPPTYNHYTGMQLDFIGSVVEAAAAHDYDVLLSPSGVDSDRSFQRLLGERRVDGAILMEIRLEDDRVDHLAALGFPSVAIGRTAHPEGTWWVGLTTPRWQRHACITSRTSATAGSPSSTVPSSCCGLDTSRPTAGWTASPRPRPSAD